MKMSFGNAIEFIREHPQFKLQSKDWEAWEYITWEWSSDKVNAVTTRLLKHDDDKVSEWTPMTKDLVNTEWNIFT